MRRVEWRPFCLLVPLLVTNVVLIIGLRKSDPPPITFSSGSTTTVLECHATGLHSTRCGPPTADGWFDPSYTWDMEDSIHKYESGNVAIGGRVYRIRDLMGRKM